METTPNKEETPQQEQTQHVEERPKEIHHHHYHKGPNFGGIFFGIILVIIGVVYLGKNLGFFPADINVNWNMLWPLVVIFIGISILGGRSWFSGIVGIIIIIAVAALVVLALFTGVGDRSPMTTSSDILIAKDTGATSARIDLATGAGVLNIRGGSDELVTGTFASNFLDLTRSSDVVDGVQVVTLKTEGSWTGFGHKTNDINLKLNPDIPTALNLDTGAIDMNVDLSTVNATSVDIDTGASDLSLVMGDKAALSNISIDAGASSITITLPKTVGAKVIVDSGVSSKDLQEFTKRDDTTYVSSTYDTAEKKVDIDLNIGATSLVVKWL